MEDRSPEQAHPTNNTRDQVDQKVGEFFQKLPQLPVDSIFGELDQIDDQLTENGVNKEARQRQIQDIAERVVSYKNGAEGKRDQMAWQPGEDKEFKKHLSELGLAPREYGQTGLRTSLKEAFARARSALTQKATPKTNP